MKCLTKKLLEYDDAVFEHMGLKQNSILRKC